MNSRLRALAWIATFVVAGVVLLSPLPTSALIVCPNPWNDGPVRLYAYLVPDRPVAGQTVAILLRMESDPSDALQAGSLKIRIRLTAYTLDGEWIIDDATRTTTLGTPPSVLQTWIGPVYLAEPLDVMIRVGIYNQLEFSQCYREAMIRLTVVPPEKYME